MHQKICSGCSQELLGGGRKLHHTQRLCGNQTASGAVHLPERGSDAVLVSPALLQAAQNVHFEHSWTRRSWRSNAPLPAPHRSSCSRFCPPVLLCAPLRCLPRQPWAFFQCLCEHHHCHHLLNGPCRPLVAAAAAAEAAVVSKKERLSRRFFAKGKASARRRQT